MAERAGGDPAPAFKFRFRLANERTKPTMCLLSKWRKKIASNDYGYQPYYSFQDCARSQPQFLPKIKLVAMLGLEPRRYYYFAKVFETFVATVTPHGQKLLITIQILFSQFCQWQNTLKLLHSFFSCFNGIFQSCF